MRVGNGRGMANFVANSIDTTLNAGQPSSSSRPLERLLGNRRGGLVFAPHPASVAKLAEQCEQRREIDDPDAGLVSPRGVGNLDMGSVRQRSSDHAGKVSALDHRDMVQI